MNLPDVCIFFFSGRNYHSYRWPDDCMFFFSGRDYITLASRGLEKPAHASRGLEEPFFQLCCCVSSLFWREIGFGSGARSLLRPEKKVLVLCLAGARSLLRPEKKVLVICLAKHKDILHHTYICYSTYVVLCPKIVDICKMLVPYINTYTN